MSPVVAAPQAEYHPGGPGVLEGAALPVDVGKHHQTAAAGRHLRRLPRHNGVGVLSPLLLGRQLRGVEGIPHPAGEGPGGVGAVPHAKGAGNGEDLSPFKGAVSIGGNKLVHKAVHTVVIEHGGAVLEEGGARLHQADADGLSGGIPSTGDHRRAGGQTGLPGCLRCDTTHNIGGDGAVGNLIRAAVEGAFRLVLRPVPLI